MLQAYATTVALEAMGAEFEVIRYKKKYTPWFAVKSLPRLLNPMLLDKKWRSLKKKLHLRRRPALAESIRVRNSAFERFEQAYFQRLSQVYHGYAALCAGSSRYRACLVGSDQLWLPSGLPTNFYNLQFAAEGVRRISYAASFGVSRIPFYQTGRTRDFLRRMDFLSVRENSAARIIKELTGQEALVVVDPTMLLDAEAWARKIPAKSPCEAPYLFAYFLGVNPAYREMVRALAGEMGLKLIAMRHMDEYVPADEGFGDEAPFDVGPAEFVNLIRHASYICTDSFHGTVFSILHGKQFVVFDRFSESGLSAYNSRNSRIQSLCENLGLTGRRYGSGPSLREALEAPIHYGQVQKRLAELRGQSLDFLSRALETTRS